MQASQYRGRRIFQAVIALVGAAIVALAVLDLSRDVAERGSMAPGTPQPVQDLTDFMDREVGYLPIDLLMLAVGGWILFFGLHGVLLNGPQLYFDKDGIRYFRFGYQTIPWDAIQQIRFVDRRRAALLRGQALDLELKDPAPFASRQPIPYRVFRRTQHMFDPKVFTIQGYDIEVPLIVVAQQMQRLVEPQNTAPPAGPAGPETPAGPGGPAGPDGA
jgi:hypothetical protein